MNENDQSRENGSLFSTWILSSAGALVCALAIFAIMSLEDLRIEHEQRSQLISMTNSFVSIFSEKRAEDGPVPATFRRLGIEHFSNNNIMQDSGTKTTVRMPGLPGFEISVVEEDPRLGQIITNFAGKKNPEPIQEHRFENCRFIGRTLYPSIANNETCAACHNEIFQEEIFKTGDVMGAFIVESDLTPIAWRNSIYAVIAFFAALGAISFLTYRERTRMHEIVLGLKARIHFETLKREAGSGGA